MKITRNLLRITIWGVSGRCKVQFKSQKLLFNGRCCAQTLKNHNSHPLRSWKNIKSIWILQTHWGKVSNATMRILFLKGYLASFADKRNLKKVTLRDQNGWIFRIHPKGGGQRPFEIFPKIHPFWYPDLSLTFLPTTPPLSSKRAKVMLCPKNRIISKAQVYNLDHCNGISCYQGDNAYSYWGVLGKVRGRFREEKAAPPRYFSTFPLVCYSSLV